MIYHKSTVLAFFSHYVACASLIALTLWVMIDIVFIKVLGVCGTHESAKSILECRLLNYHFTSAIGKWIDDGYSWKAFLGRAFAVYDEAQHNMDGVCGKSFGAATAKASYCKKGMPALGYAKNVSLLLFYVWGPLVVAWYLLKRIFIRKVPIYAAN